MLLVAIFLALAAAVYFVTMLREFARTRHAPRDPRKSGEPVAVRPEKPKPLNFQQQVVADFATLTTKVDALTAAVVALTQAITTGLAREETTMAQMVLDVTALTASVTNALGAEQSAIVLLQGLSAAIASLQAQVAAGGIDPAEAAAALATLQGQIDTGTASLAAAVAANPVPA